MSQPHDYAAYIWPAYILTGLVWAALIVASLAQARRWKTQAEKAKTP